MEIRQKLEESIKKALKKLGIQVEKIVLEHPDDKTFGDYSTSIALSCAKKLKENPRALAEKILAELLKNKPEEIEKLEIAGAGFINFHLSKKFFISQTEAVLKFGEKFGKNENLKGEKIMVEYTDPNPFKPFHIGHLMSNTIGETLSRIMEAGGAEVKRACYQGDVGLHVAKAIFGILKIKSEMPKEKSSASEKAVFLGKAYVLGANAYEDDKTAKTEIDDLNKVIFEKSDKEINKIYDWGRGASLEHFEEIYPKLGTKFDYYFFESEMAPMGIFLSEELLAKGIFEKSDLLSPSSEGFGKASGAVIFPGEKYGLHTRVFVNSKGLPTYEAKDLGLAKKKKETYAFDTSISVTGNEQNAYFKVMLKALEFVDSNIANKTRHIGHGMMRFAGGKMSSRKGNVITGESLINDMVKLAEEKMEDRDLSPEQKKEIAEAVGVGAIKYSILKQGIGRDIIFDFEKSVSLDGDSGPYLQYAHTRAVSVLEKAKKAGIKASVKLPSDKTGEVVELEKMLYRFPEIVERAGKEYAPHFIATYLLDLAGVFNSSYASTKIVDEKDPLSSYRIALTESFKIVMENGLKLLGIKAPEKM